MTLSDYSRCLRPGRKVQGISAVLLPFTSDGRMDERAFRQHLCRTVDAGLRVAVNMDTGYIDLLTPAERERVLRWTAETVGGRDWFCAGALPVGGATPLSAKACARAYAVQCARIAEAGGVPVIFPSPGTRALDDAGLIALFGEIASSVDRFVAFELGEMFNPNGGMFSEPVLTELMKMPQCIGLKHSSLERGTEIARLKLRDRVRTDFAIYSGNDLAPDMIEYGSDYLLGLSTFAPELFVARDRAWSAGARSYLELRDLIQYLGWIGFREPVPAYKHSAAIFLKLTGSLECDEPHPRAPRREDWDRGILADAGRRLRRLMPSETGSS
jgi:dihydrodipicolinate synthase/N-acetylneuraminate lyase